MNLYINIILNVIFITYPLLLYLFYIAYNKNYLRAENNLFLDIAIISSSYLIIRFNNSLIFEVPFILINVQLIIAYIKRRNGLIFILSFIYIYIYYSSYKFNLFLLLLEYIGYYLLFLFALKKNKLNDYFIKYFFLIKSIFFIVNILLIFYNKIDINLIFNIFCSLVMFFSITFFTVFLFEKGEDIIRYHMSMKELEREKQIRTSLFKITHEIKNPIAVCKGYLDMFDVNNSEHSIKYIPILKEEIERVLIILQDFLSLTRANINLDVMDIYMLLDDIYDNFYSFLKSKNIEFSVNIPDSEVYINGDYNKLKQVFINIIKNSLEAIEEKNVAGRIVIDTDLIDDYVLVRISDNGIGMDDDVLAKINEPFFTTKVNGTGLGTSLSFEIIKAHNGKINYESSLSSGTTVNVYLKILN